MRGTQPTGFVSVVFCVSNVLGVNDDDRSTVTVEHDCVDLVLVFTPISVTTGVRHSRMPSSNRFPASSPRAAAGFFGIFGPNHFVIVKMLSFNLTLCR